MSASNSYIAATLLLFSLTGCLNTPQPAAIDPKTTSEPAPAVIEGIDPKLLETALEAFKDEVKHYNRLVVVDFNSPSTENRFYIINLVRKEVEIKTLVSHAAKSGFKTPFNFSNKKGSNISSIGRFVTAEPYYGKNGLSVKIDGIDKGINDNARSRNIVIHGSDYAEREFVKKNGMLGRSKGCFAIPMSKHKEVAKLLSEPTIMYVHRSFNKPQPSATP